MSSSLVGAVSALNNYATRGVSKLLVLTLIMALSLALSLKLLKFLGLYKTTILPACQYRINTHCQTYSKAKNGQKSERLKRQIF